MKIYNTVIQKILKKKKKKKQLHKRCQENSICIKIMPKIYQQIGKKNCAINNQVKFLLFRIMNSFIF